MHVRINSVRLYTGQGVYIILRLQLDEQGHMTDGGYFRQIQVARKECL